MRTLRGEVKTRKACLRADVERILADKYQRHQVRLDKLKAEVEKLTDEANAKLARVVARYSDVVSRRVYDKFYRPNHYRSGERKEKFRKLVLSEIEAQALDSVKSDAAKDFLTRIPTIGDLMPGPNMEHIETKFHRGWKPRRS